MYNLSIIIPHYNSTSSLKKLINTIPDVNEIQVIIIDDHSDAEHKNELIKFEKHFNRSNVEFYNNDPNKKGAGACRNIGLLHARGKWLLFADADDYFLEGFFDTVKKYFNSKCDVVF